MLTGHTSALGLPLVFSSHDAHFLRAAIAAYPAENVPAEGPVHHVQLEATGGVDGIEEPAIVVDDKKIYIRGGGIFGGGDASAREGWCALPNDRIADPLRFAEALDPVVLFLLTRSGRIPLHASVVMFERTAVVFAGRSGSGKSTLALAAHEAGMSVISDDTAYLQLTPRFRVWGLPRPIHVFAKDAPIEELPLRQRSGRWKKAVVHRRSQTRADHAILCLLERGSHVDMAPMTPDMAVERIMHDLEPGFDHFREQLPPAIHALAAPDAWRLQLSANPAEAIAHVQQVLNETLTCTSSM